MRLTRALDTPLMRPTPFPFQIDAQADGVHVTIAGAPQERVEVTVAATAGNATIAAWDTHRVDLDGAGHGSLLVPWKTL